MVKKSKSKKVNQKKTEKSKSKKDTPEETEQIEINFSGIKKFFSNVFSKSSSKKKPSYSNALIITLLLLIPLFLSVDLRMLPADLPITNDWARQTVYAGIRNKIQQQISAEYPYMPDANKQTEVNNQFNNLLMTKKTNISKSIDATAKHFKNRLKNENGYTYLLAIDPYQYYRYARDIIEHGFPGDSLINGKPFDAHMVAPLGVNMGFNLHPYLEAYWYKFLRLFGFKDLMGTTFFVPIILSALTIFPAFFIGKKFAGNLGGFSAATLIAVAPAFISRSVGGFADTDPYNVLFPLLVTWFFLESFQRKSLKTKLLFSSLTGITVAFFGFFWDWWFIFDLILGTILAYLIFVFIKTVLINKKKLGKDFINTIYVLLVFIFTSGIILSLKTSVVSFISYPFITPIKLYFYKTVATSSVWPNVFTTVAEQNSASIQSVMKTMGGAILFIFSLFGIYLTTHRFKEQKTSDYIFLTSSLTYFTFIVLMFYQKAANSAFLKNPFSFIGLALIPFAVRYVYLLLKKEEVDIKFSILMLAWFAMMFFASVRGVRYSLLLVSPFVIGVGIFIGFAYFFVSKIISKVLDLDINITKPIILILVLLLLIQPIKAGYKTAYHEIPSMNDAWYQSLHKIDEEAQPNAIVNSWWDFGHWFKAIADRAVTFDGASQNTPMAYWIGKSLLTSNENATVGILRMLDCGSNNAFKELNKVINNTPLSIDILNKIILQDKELAKQTLQSYNLSPKQINDVLQNTHCNPPEDYYITSNDMVSKSGVWAHFGAWDFTRASMYKDVKPLKLNEGISLLKTKYNLSDSKASLYYDQIHTQKANDWIAPWPSYATQISQCIKKGDLLQCPNNINGNTIPFMINLTTMDTYVPTQTGLVKPISLVYPTATGYSLKKYNGKISLSIGLIPGKDKFYSFTMQPSLAESTFTKLFFYDGHGMKCFKPFSEQTQFTGGKILVWKVDWNCSQGPNIQEQLQSQIQQKLDNLKNQTNSSK